MRAGAREKVKASVAPVIFLLLSAWICLEALEDASRVRRGGPATGLRVRHMPTTGGGPIMMAILGKHGDISHCVMPAVCGPQIEARKIRLLALTSHKRLPAYPDVPTLRELGYDVTHSIWHAWMVPAGTPPEGAARLRQGLRAWSRTRRSRP
jgi:tripartite-type tricarboxylate transporter receptor subunit TctC